MPSLYITNDDVANAAEVSYFKLNTIINNQFTRQLALAFLPDATDGIDLGIDALNIDKSLPNDVAFWLENGNYIIQGLNFNPSKNKGHGKVLEKSPG